MKDPTPILIVIVSMLVFAAPEEKPQPTPDPLEVEALAAPKPEEHKPIEPGCKCEDCKCKEDEIAELKAAIAELESAAINITAPAELNESQDLYDRVMDYRDAGGNQRYWHFNGVYANRQQELESTANKYGIAPTLIENYSLQDLRYLHGYLHAKQVATDKGQTLKGWECNGNSCRRVKLR